MMNMLQEICPAKTDTYFQEMLRTCILTATTTLGPVGPLPPDKKLNSIEFIRNFSNIFFICILTFSLGFLIFKKGDGGRKVLCPEELLVWLRKQPQ